MTREREGMPGADLWSEGDALVRRGRFDEALSVYRRAGAEGANPSRECLATSLCALYRGDYSGAVHQSELALRGRAIDEAARAGLSCVVSMAQTASGRHVLARQNLERAASLGTNEVVVRRLIARARGNLAMATGMFDDAVAAYETQVDSSPPTAHWERSIALFNLGESLLEIGDLERSATVLEQSEAIKDALDDSWGLAYLQRTRARAQLARGAVLEAVVSCQAGLRHADRVGERRVLSGLYCDLGRAAALTGDFGLARRAAEEARSNARACGAQDELLRAAVVEAEAEALAGEAAEALGRARWVMQHADPETSVAVRANVVVLLCSPSTSEKDRNRSMAACGELDSPIEALETQVQLSWQLMRRGEGPASTAVARLRAEAARLKAARLEALATACTQPDDIVALDTAEAILRLLGCRPEAEQVLAYREAGGG